MFYFRINPEELVKYQELDIIFDNDGSFTIEESQVEKLIKFIITFN